jgi:uncharacterized protein involved in exopolysaccharide biosynthesis
MKESLNQLESAELQSQPEGVGMIDVLILLAKNKKLLLGVPVAVAAAAVGLSLTMIPPTYRASTTILPPQQAQSSAASLLAQFGGAGGLVANAAGIKNPNDLYVGMLQSRRVSDALIQRFSLLQEYGTDSHERARKLLAENTMIGSGKDNMITVTVEDGRKQQVADIANAYIEELIKLTKTLAVTEAAQRRVFYERQLEQAKTNLATAEANLKRALDKHGVISVDVESRAVVETVARLRARISAKEIQFNALKAFVTPSHQDYKQTEQELNSLRAELDKLENGRDVTGAAGSNVNPAGLENIKLLRDVKYNQTLYELMAKQYEVARLDEVRDAPVVQVLDAAITPEKKSKPQPLLLGVSSFAISLFAVLAFVFWRETKSRLMRGAGFRTKWIELRSELRIK